MLGSDAEDVIILEEPLENVHLNIRHTKDFQFLTVNVFTTQLSKVCLLECFEHPIKYLKLNWIYVFVTHC